MVFDPLFTRWPKHPVVVLVDVGEERPRTVCTGIVAHVPIEEMEVGLSTCTGISPVFIGFYMLGGV